MTGSATSPALAMNFSATNGLTGNRQDTLTIRLADTGFTGTVPLLSSIGGQLSAGNGNSLSYRTAGDASGISFGTATSLATQSFGPGAYSGSAPSSGISGSPYSLTLEVVIRQTGAGTTTGDPSLVASAVPEASTAAMGGLGLLMLAAARLRRRSSD